MDEQKVASEPITLERKCELGEEVLKGISRVLLLSMSTFPNDLKVNTYQTPDKTQIEGFGQLEPVPKFLKAKSEPLDLIVIMASAETLEMKGVKMGDDSYYASPVSLFEHNIADDYEKEGYEIRFKVIKSGTLDALQEMLNLFRTLKEKEEKLKLYMDIHGGPREDQLLIDAMVYLLREEGIKPKETYTVNMFNKEIVEVNEMMQAFDLTAGINEFLNYGRSGSLERILSDQNNLVKNIRGISDAISLCRMKEFKKQRKILKKNIDDLKKKPVDDYLQLFCEQIENDYNKYDLLEENGSLSNLIRWCVSKEFYQQALTIIESQVPGWLRDKKANRLVWDIEKAGSNIEHSASQNKEVKITRSIRDWLFLAREYSNTPWEEFNNYAFEALKKYAPILNAEELTKCIEPVNQEFEEKRYRLSAEELEKCIEQFSKSTREACTSEFNCERTVYYKKKSKQYKKSKNQYSLQEFKNEICRSGGGDVLNFDVPFVIKYQGNRPDVFYVFLKLHFTLKDMRNTVNHASDDKIPSLETVKTAILIYAACMDEMIEDCAKKK